MISLLLASSFAQAASFDFDGLSSADLVQSKALTTYASQIKAVELQNFQVDDGSVVTTAVVAAQFGKTSNVMVLSGESCSGKISSGCFDGHTIVSAAVDISDNTAAYWGWTEDGTFEEMGSVELDDGDDTEWKVTFDLSDHGILAETSFLNDDGAAAMMDPFLGGMLVGAAVVALGVSIGYTLSVNDIVHVLPSGDGDGNEGGDDNGGGDGNDCECDGTDDTIDSGGDSGGDSGTGDDGVGRSHTPIDPELLFDADEVINADNISLEAA